MRSILSSAERVVLECRGCAERIVLGGPEDVWLSGRTTFECECGRRLTLAHRIEEGERDVAAASARSAAAERAGPANARKGRVAAGG